MTAACVVQAQSKIYLDKDFTICTKHENGVKSNAYMHAWIHINLEREREREREREGKRD